MATNWFKFYLLPAAIIGAMSLGAAVVLAPWWNVAPIPVQLRLEAPADSQIRIAWGDRADQSLPFVPVVGRQAPTPKLWLAELPPRPEYRVTIIFESPMQNAILRGISFIDVQHVESPIFKRKPGDPSDWFTADGVQIKDQAPVMLLTSAPGRRLVLSEPIYPPREPAVACIMTIWLCLTVTIGTAILLIAPLFRARGEVAPPRAAGKFDSAVGRVRHRNGDSDDRPLPRSGGPGRRRLEHVSPESDRPGTAAHVRPGRMGI